MDRLGALRLFVRVAERGSFSSAARDLGVGQPSVSKQIAALEDDLGATLFNRTTRGLMPTDAGRDLLHASRRLLADLDEVETRIRTAHRSPAGSIRVAVPPGLGSMYLVPSLPRFLDAFPDVSVELLVSERRVDLVEENVDVAVRVGWLGDSSLASRRIGSLRTITLATPNYLAAFGEPAHPDDLSRHRLVAVRLLGAPAPWHFRGKAGPFSIDPQSRVRLDNAENLRSALVAGLGIGHGPSALFTPDVRSGALRQILADYAPESTPIHAVRPSGSRLARRVDAFVEFLAEVCAAEPELRRD